MKHCNKCNKDLEESMFSKKKNGLQSYCKKCSTKTSIEYNKSHLKEKKEYRKEKIKSRKSFIEDYKKSHSCVICGEQDPVCLDFHHKNKEEKDFQISHMIRGGWSLERIKEEIDKCEMLCANCHRKKHKD